jgi:hypothetical protein
LKRGQENVMSQYGKDPGPKRIGLSLVRRVIVDLFKAGALAVANDVGIGWEAEFPGRIVEVETFLGALGATSGATTIDVKKNGVSIFTVTPSIAFGAATRRRRDCAGPLVPSTTVGSSGTLTPVIHEPAGVPFAPGDYFRLDVLAIPGTTSTDLSVTLSILEEDV